MELTEFGVFTLARALGAENFAEAAALAEELGFGTIWVGGSPRLPDLRSLFEATERIVVATGIANIWQYEAEAMAAEFHELDQEFPGRLLLGVGIGHRENTTEYAKPLTKTREFVDGLQAAPVPVPLERLVLAALGPKMLELSAERSLGAHPYFTPPDHTRYARELIGAGALLAPEQAVVIDEDSERARAVAREYAARYLNLSNYANNLRRTGWAEADLTDGGSDRLVDTIVPQGTPADAARAARAHLEAGANHVCVQTLGVSGVPRSEWTALASAFGLQA
jgi:probable F420-dependent oxidoreductase